MKDVPEQLGAEQRAFSNPGSTPQREYPGLPLAYVGRIQINAPFLFHGAVVMSTYTIGGQFYKLSALFSARHNGHSSSELLCERANFHRLRLASVFE